MKKRCEWVPKNDQLYCKYHDIEWGTPVHNDKLLFESLILDGAQAGLSWITILRKRANYRKAYENFDITAVAAFDDQKFEQLLKNSGIIRNRLKLKSSISNAKIAADIVKEFGSFNRYIWGFVGGKTIVNSWIKDSEIPTSSKESDHMSSDLKTRGFKFVGTTICYAFMQAVGMVNDHIVSCFRYNELNNLK